MTAVLFTPVPAELAWSSLGFSAAWRGLAPCEIAVLEQDPSGPVRSVESGRSLSDFDVVFVSVAWELEVPLLARALATSGIQPDRRLRPDTHPLVVGGGPLTRSNPDLLAAVADAVFLGEADDAFIAIRRALSDAEGRQDARVRLESIHGCWVPDLRADGAPPPAPVQAARTETPLCSPMPLRPNRFGGAFLIEVGRGCPRSCGFCVARTGVGPARFAPAERILGAVPEGVDRVGLLGAAVSDHPQLLPIVRSLLDRNIQVTLGSVRADRASLELTALLARSGMKTLTIAADGASEALRASIRKDIQARDLLAAADAARDAGMTRLRLYVMVGLPGEQDADLGEFCDLAGDLASRLRLAVSVSPFVPKRFTPLEAAPFLPVREQKRRLAELRRRLGHRVQLRMTSPREAELEYRLSHVTAEAARAYLSAPTMDAIRASGEFER